MENGPPVPFEDYFEPTTLKEEHQRAIVPTSSISKASQEKLNKANQSLREKKRGVDRFMSSFKAGLESIDIDTITAKIQEASKVQCTC